MVLAMHAGFAFRERGPVRRRNQLITLMSILVDFYVTTIVYLFGGCESAYGVTSFRSAPLIRVHSGHDVVKSF